MSLLVSRIFRCDRCSCESRDPYRHLSITPTENPPPGWTAIRFKGVLHMHFCPDCWPHIRTDPDHPGVLFLNPPPPPPFTAEKPKNFGPSPLASPGIVFIPDGQIKLGPRNEG